MRRLRRLAQAELRDNRGQGWPAWLVLTLGALLAFFYLAATWSVPVERRAPRITYMPHTAYAASELSDGFSALVLTAAAPKQDTGEGHGPGAAPTEHPPLPGWMPAGVLVWEQHIRTAAAEHSMDPLLLAIAVAIECGTGNAGCTSPNVGARGLMQVMPGTARGIQAQTGYPCYDDPYDGLTSLRCGAWYLRECMRMAASLWAPGLEAETIGAAGYGYNAGPGRIAGVVAHVKAGGAVCDAPPPEDFSPANWEQPKSWCNQAVGMWRRAGRQ